MRNQWYESSYLLLESAGWLGEQGYIGVVASAIFSILPCHIVSMTSFKIIIQPKEMTRMSLSYRVSNMNLRAGD
jgi:hypothetical protein